MSSRVWESHVFDVPVATVWRRLRDLDFAMLFSSSVQSCELVEGSSGGAFAMCAPLTPPDSIAAAAAARAAARAATRAAVGSQRIVKFSDGAQWTVLMREISGLLSGARPRQGIDLTPSLPRAPDDQYTVTWEVVGTEPPAAFTSRVDTIRLRRVTHVRRGRGRRHASATASPVRRAGQLHVCRVGL